MFEYSSQSPCLRCHLWMNPFPLSSLLSIFFFTSSQRNLIMCHSFRTPMWIWMCSSFFLPVCTPCMFACVCVLYLVISLVFVCIRVTLRAVGLLFWPQPALESHLHPSQSSGLPWGPSSVLSPSPYLQTLSSFSPGSTSGLWPGALGGGRLCRWQETGRSTHAHRSTQCTYKDTHTKSSRGSIPPAAVNEREEEIGKRRGLLIGITKALLMKGSCVCKCVGLGVTVQLCLCVWECR